MTNIPYTDIADFDMDTRVEMIGHQVTAHQQIVGFITESTPGKIENYISKLKEKFPGIQILSQDPGPIPGTVLVRVGPASGGQA
jgi:hypothetical protein